MVGAGDADQPPWMALSTRVGIEEAAYHDRSGLNADSSATPHAHARARSKISLARRALTRILTLPPAATADPKGSQSPLYLQAAVVLPLLLSTIRLEGGPLSFLLHTLR